MSVINYPIFNSVHLVDYFGQLLVKYLALTLLQVFKQTRHHCVTFHRFEHGSLLPLCMCRQPDTCLRLLEIVNALLVLLHAGRRLDARHAFLHFSHEVDSRQTTRTRASSLKIPASVRSELDLSLCWIVPAFGFSIDTVIIHAYQTFEQVFVLLSAYCLKHLLPILINLALKCLHVMWHFDLIRHIVRCSSSSGLQLINGEIHYRRRGPRRVKKWNLSLHTGRVFG